MPASLNFLFLFFNILQVINIKDFEIHIEKRKIISAGEFNIHSNEQISISGPNGSGKTSFLKTLVGQMSLAKGQIAYNFDTNDPYSQISFVSFMDESKAFGDRKNQFYQQRFHAAFSDGYLSVKDYLLDLNPEEDILENDFIKVFHIDELWNRELLKLSSGQTRKVILAKAIMNKPKLLLLDNPYVGLDMNARADFNSLIDKLVKELKLSLIICDHETDLPECINRHYFIENKTLVEFKTPKEHFGELGILNPIEEQIVALYQTSSRVDILDVFLEMNDVKISYADHIIVNHINWVVKKGERWWLRGPNGSGKSALISMIYADIPQGYGQRLKLFGSPPGDGRTIWDIKKYIGFSSPELHFFMDSTLTSQEMVFTGIADQFVKTRPDKLTVDLSDLFFSYFSIDHLKEQFFRKLSSGEQRLILLIRALIKRPLLLLLDEPFQAFDKHMIYKAKRLLELIVHEHMAMIFVSHQNDEIPEGITDRFIL